MAVETKFLVALNLTGNEIRNVNLQNLPEAPVVTSADVGRIYYNTVEKKPKFWNGESWQDFGQYDTTYTFTPYTTTNGEKGFTWTDSNGNTGNIVILTVDSEMSDTSENTVQNKVIKQYVDEIVTHVYAATNPAYTVTSSGVFVWTISTVAESRNSVQSVIVYDNSTGEQVYPNIAVVGDANPDIVITIAASEGTVIEENTYIARYIH